MNLNDLPYKDILRLERVNRIIEYSFEYNEFEVHYSIYNKGQAIYLAIKRKWRDKIREENFKQLEK